MLENGMVCEDNQIPALTSTKNIYESKGTILYWIICKATDEEDLLENLEDIKKQDESQADEGEDSD